MSTIALDLLTLPLAGAVIAVGLLARRVFHHYLSALGARRDRSGAPG